MIEVYPIDGTQRYASVVGRFDDGIDFGIEENLSIIGKFNMFDLWIFI